MEFFDSHAHYDDAKFDDNRDNLIKDIYNSGVTKIISAGYSLEGSKKSLELSRKYNFIYSTVGISPNDLVERDLEENITKANENNGIQVENNKFDSINNNYPQIDDNMWKQNIEEIDKLINANLSSKRIVAIGEIGLDYHYDTDKKIQYEAFSKQIDIANKYNLPIVIHTRDAVMDTLTMLKEHPANKKGVFHCCPLNRELVKEALKLGFYISMAGPVTFKNSKNANEIIEMCPLDRILIETDSPYLAPEPVRGTRNDSRNLKYIAHKIASVKGVTIEEVAEATYKNTMRCFEID
mgnify:CR=1 FL=1